MDECEEEGGRRGEIDTLVYKSIRATAGRRVRGWAGGVEERGYGGGGGGGRGGGEGG